MNYKIRTILFSLLLFVSFSLFGCTNTGGDVLHNNGTASTSDPKMTLPSEQMPISKDNETQKVDGTFRAYYFDVGQGDSIYLKMPGGEDVLIDAGDNSYGDDVVQYLKDLKVDDLEAVISTHPDADHSGGLDIVFKNFKVESVYAPQVSHTTDTFLDFVTEVKNQGLKMTPVNAGLKLPFDSIDAMFVAPVKEYGSDLNDWNAVLKVSFGETSFLFTGDAPIKSENDMINSDQDLQADVLKLGHHGSDTSSSDAFLNAVKPKFAIISAGANNKYGHPKKSVVDRLNAYKIDIYQTDKQGTIIATSNGKNIVFDTTKLYENNNINSSVPVKSTTPSTPQKESATDNNDEILSAKVDNPTPKKNSIIQLIISGQNGVPFTAVCHYKSKDTIYSGTVGIPLPIMIGGASSGYEVVIDVTTKINSKTYTAKTSFIPQ